MFGIEDFSAFLLSAIIFTISPGLDTIFILNKSISQGRLSAMYASFGIISGLMVHILLATFGLSAILAQSEIMFSVVKFAGAGYLFYLGIRAILSKATALDLSINEELEEKGKWQNFREGIFTNLLNPKVALFFLSFFPQFIKKEAIDSFTPYWVLGGVSVAIALVWFLLLSYFAGTFSEKFKENPQFNIWLNKMSGVIFILMGLKVAFTE